MSTPSRGQRIGLAFIVCIAASACGESRPAEEDAERAPPSGSSEDMDAGTKEVRDDARGTGSTRSKPGRDGGASSDGEQTSPEPSDESEDASSPDADAPHDGQDAAAPVTGDGSISEPGEAATRDAGGSDAAASQCVDLGEECEQAACCGEAACVRRPGLARAVCANLCEAPDGCAPSCGPYCGASPGGPASRCSEPLRIIAQDSSYLGEASSRATAESVCSRAGGNPYASTTSPYSIYNAGGLYGEELGPQSAFNPRAFTPPALICPGTREIVAYVTKSTTPLNPATKVDPAMLCDWLRQRGW